MSGQNTVTPTADSLIEAAKAAKARGTPPLEKWNPEFCGDLDMQIKRDGTWFYQGTPIGRIEMVKLFASILWREGDDYFLKTPVEKVGITVEDAPFVAVDFEAEGAGAAQQLRFLTNLGDVAEAGAAHPIRVVRDEETGEPAPYVLVRRNLEALIDRKSFYRWSIWASTAMAGRWSGRVGNSLASSHRKTCRKSPKDPNADHPAANLSLPARTALSGPVRCSGGGGVWRG